MATGTAGPKSPGSGQVLYPAKSEEETDMNREHAPRMAVMVASVLMVVGCAATGPFQSQTAGGGDATTVAVTPARKETRR